MTDELPDLSETYDEENPKPKRGRPPLLFPSGKTVSQLATELPCCATLVRKWTLGLRVPAARRERFYRLAGITSDDEWHQWKSSRLD